jgi:hypothetical protein
MMNLKACAEGHDLLTKVVVKSLRTSRVIELDVGLGDIHEHAACLADVEVDITDEVHRDS